MPSESAALEGTTGQPDAALALAIDEVGHLLPRVVVQQHFSGLKELRQQQQQQEEEEEEEEEKQEELNYQPAEETSLQTHSNDGRIGDLFPFPVPLRDMKNS